MAPLFYRGHTLRAAGWSPGNDRAVGQFLVTVRLQSIASRTISARNSIVELLTSGLLSGVNDALPWIIFGKESRNLSKIPPLAGPSD